MLGMITTSSIIPHINQLLQSALMAWEKSNYQLCRDNVIRTLTLLDLVDRTKFDYATEIKTAQLVLKCLQVELTNKLKGGTIIATPSTSKIATIDRSECSDNELSLSLLEGAHITTTFDDIIGCDQAKQWLEENVILQFNMTPAIRAQLFQGIRSGAGNVLLYGPPGTGKTLLAQAAANECQAKFIDLKPSDILSKYQGESERFVSKIFNTAKAYGKAIIFLDEFDSIAATRVSGEDSAQSRRLLSELLLQLTLLKSQSSERKRKRGDDVKESSVVVIAATNRFEDIDEAVLRRFECKVPVGVPNNHSRKQLVVKFLQGIDHELGEEDLNYIANLTFGWSGSDIEVLCREAAMIPLREFRSTVYAKDLEYNENNIVPLRFLVRSDFEIAHKAVVIEVGQELNEENI